MKYFILNFIFLLTVTHLNAQDVNQNNNQQGIPDTTTVPGARVTQARLIKGVVQNAKDGTTLPGATVLLRKAFDNSTVTGAITDIDGRFRFEKIATGHYTVNIDYIGFKPFAKAILVQQQNVDLGVLKLQEESTTIDEVIVIGRIPPGEQKGDTTQFNAAAFKTAPDASAQDLVQKMPGITIEDGQVQAQGEAVQRILIDGKPYFGNDVDAALQNLPAQIIANIQVFDKRSDKAELSGFDDGERIRTINIVTKPEARKGQFGKVTAGYGTDNSYLAGASVNFFKNDRRLTLTGLSNNINLLSFSADPENIGESRTQNGIIKSNVVGLNYINTWFNKIDVASNYSFNHRNQDEAHSRFRDFVQSEWPGHKYTEKSQNNTISGDHRFNSRLDYEINEQNKIRVRTRGNFYQNEFESYREGQTNYDKGLLNSTVNNTNGDNASINLNNNIVYSHRFPKAGRSLNFQVNNGYNTRNNNSYRDAINAAYENGEDIELLNQYFRTRGTGYSWETQASYTEPIGRFGQVELEYEIGNRVDDNDRRAFDIINPEIDLQLDHLSNSFTNEYLTQETELGYRYNNERLFVQLEGEYQHAKLMTDQQLPTDLIMERTFTSFLPSARLRYIFTESNNLELNYDSRTNAPSLNQLQEVVNNSNPLYLSTGNQDLRQSFRNWIRARYRAHNPDTNHNFYASVTASLENNVIVNSIITQDIASYVNDEIKPITGAQLSRPINLDGYRDVRSYFSYGQPIGFIQSNLNVNGGISYTRRPGNVDDQINFSNASRFRAGVSLSSNISERIDFNISTRSTFNVVRNTLRPAQNDDFFSQRTRLWYNWIFGDGFVYRTNINHQLNTGLSEGFNLNTILWNMSIGKKLFANQLGEISVSVYDLLRQNNNIRRNIDVTYIEDTESNVLDRYFMLTFTYNIRNFGGGDVKDISDLY